ncbi:MAG: RNA methyltransferase [Pseudobutyrivibrio sp.]|nr:RNA methyltransferase [Pseudobutyrivibrio sp.]
MITSTNNNRIKNIISLNKKARERKAQRLFVVEGIRAVSEVPKDLLSAIYYVEGFLESQEGVHFFANLFGTKENMSEETVSQLATDQGFYAESVATNVFNSMTDTVTPQGLLAIVKMQDWTLDDVTGKSKSAMSHVMILESLQDPGNMGTIVRTAEGAGCTGIIMNTTTVDIYSPKVVRSTMGSIFRVPHLVVSDLAQTVETLKNDYGISLYAAHLKGQKFYHQFDYRGPVGFMIGNEGNGLTDETANLASSYLKIPMEGQLESLNASVAASLLMYEVHRQRNN